MSKKYYTLILLLALSSCVNVDTNTANGQYLMGEQKCDEGDYTSAFKWYEKAANQNHAKSQYMLGQFYLDDKIVREDHIKSIDYFTKSANQGCTEAMYQLGALYGLGYAVTRDKDISLNWYKKAAKLGHKESKKMVRGLYLMDHVK